MCEQMQLIFGLSSFSLTEIDYFSLLSSLAVIWKFDLWWSCNLQIQSASPPVHLFLRLFIGFLECLAKGAYTSVAVVMLFILHTGTL